uniref:Uncharacterized protein n=1 Tax=Rhizophora mucronata TaxID=61149 RepID=A0A2P2PV95_RHIMU
MAKAIHESPSKHSKDSRHKGYIFCIGCL